MSVGMRMAWLLSGMVFMAAGNLQAAAPAVFHSVGVGGGGALYSTSFNPRNPRDIWMPTDMGELFHTLDGGATWTYPELETLTAHVDSRVQWTDVDGTIYVHEYNGYPAKSTDGGKTWLKLKNWGYFTEGPCKQVRADPGNAARLFGCSDKALAFSTDGGATFRKIWEKSDGKLWVSGLFADGQKLWVATTDGLLVSADGGQTWGKSDATGLPAGTIFASFCGAKHDQTVRFWATVVNAACGELFVYGPGVFQQARGLFRMDAGDKAWSDLSGALPAGYTVTLVASATGDVATVWAGGARKVPVTQDYAVHVPAMLKSTDGGKNWTPMFQCAGNKNVHTDWYGEGHDYDWAYAGPAMSISVCSANANYAAFSNLFGAWGTEDGGQTWRSLVAGIDALNKPGVTNRPNAYHASTLNNTASWHLLWLDKETIISGSNDITAFRSVDGGRTWQFPKYIGNRFNATYRLAYDTGNNIVYAAMSNAHDLYQGVNMGDGNVDGRNGGIFYSKDKGATWQPLCAFAVELQGQKYFNPVLGVALDPKVPNRMYALVGNHLNGGVYRTDDLNKGAGATWTKLPSPPRTEGHPWDIKILNDGTLVVTYAGRLDAAGKMTASSGVFISADAGQTWEDRTAPANESSMNRNTQDVVIDPRDPSQNTWYACVDYVVYLPDAWPDPKVGLFKTTDRGRTWKRIFSETRVGARSAAINPATHEMYLTTNNGLWYAEDANKDQPKFTKVPDVRYPAATRVFLNPYKPSEVWVATFGGGVMRGDSTAAR